MSVWRDIKSQKTVEQELCGGKLLPIVKNLSLFCFCVLSNWLWKLAAYLGQKNPQD